MKSAAKTNNQAGFSLIEVTAAVVILLVVLLGVFSAYTYAIIYNTGNNTRSQALSVLQREIELMRSYKFTPVKTDTEIAGGTKSSKYVPSADGTNYKVDIIIDDDPTTSGVQVDTTKPIKEITITVVPTNQVAGWQTAISSQIVMRRTRGN